MRYVLVAISALVLFFPVFWLFSYFVGVNWGAGIAAFFMYIWYPFMALKFISRNEKSNIDSMSQALSNGELVVDEYEVKNAIEFEECEDEGMFYLLDVGDNRTLCLNGQYLYEPVENGIFPSSKLKLFWNKRFRITYGIECDGSKILIKRKLPPLNENQIDSGVIPKDRDLLEQNIEDVVKNIEKNA